MFSSELILDLLREATLLWARNVIREVKPYAKRKELLVVMQDPRTRRMVPRVNPEFEKKLESFETLQYVRNGMISRGIKGSDFEYSLYEYYFVAREKHSHNADFKECFDKIVSVHEEIKDEFVKREVSEHDFDNLLAKYEKTLYSIEGLREAIREEEAKKNAPKPIQNSTEGAIIKEEPSEQNQSDAEHQKKIFEELPEKGEKTKEEGEEKEVTPVRKNTAPATSDKLEESGFDMVDAETT